MRKKVELLNKKRELLINNKNNGCLNNTPPVDKNWGDPG